MSLQGADATPPLRRCCIVSLSRLCRHSVPKSIMGHDLRDRPLRSKMVAGSGSCRNPSAMYAILGMLGKDLS